MVQSSKRAFLVGVSTIKRASFRLLPFRILTHRNGSEMDIFCTFVGRTPPERIRLRIHGFNFIPDFATDVICNFSLRLRPVLPVLHDRSVR